MDSEAALFKALSDSTRLRIMILLSFEGETCVCRLAEALCAPDSKISRHLSILRAAGMVTARREGTWMYYSIVQARNRMESCLQECFSSCLSEHETVQADLGRLAKATCG